METAMLGGEPEPMGLFYNQEYQKYADYLEDENGDF